MTTFTIAVFGKWFESQSQMRQYQECW